MRNRVRLAAILVTLVISLTAIGPVVSSSVNAAVNTYYVSTTGNDSNNGSSGAPWKTILYASKHIGAGDTVIVSGGIYAEDAIWSYATGTADAPITLKAAPGEYPVITGSGMYNQILHFQPENKYFIIDGLNTANTSGTAPVCISPGADHITLRNCSFKDNAGDASVFMEINQSSYITIENCELNTTGGDLTGDGEGDGIYVNASNHCLIQNNHFVKCGHYATDFKDYNDAGATTSYNNIFRNNLIEQYWGGGVGLIFGAYNNLVENNSIYYVGAECTYPKTGVQIAADKNIVRNNIFGWSSDGSRGGAIDDSISLLSYRLNGMDQNCRDNRLYNNTIYKSGGKPVIISEKDNTVITGNKMLNNIFYYDRTYGTREWDFPVGNWYIVFDTYKSSSYSVWNASFPRSNSFYNNIFKHADATNKDYTNVSFFYYNGGQVSAKSFGKTLNEIQTSYPKYFYGNKEVNPAFVNPDNGDFRLSAGSPAIDAGANLAVTTAAGAATTIVPVDDALFFTDGYGIVSGDAIMVGSQTVTIISVDYTANVLTVSTPVTFSQGDSVNLVYKGAAPDIGTVEYDSSSTPMPTLATMIPKPTPVVTPTPIPTPTPVPTPTPIGPMVTLGNSIDLAGKVTNNARDKLNANDSLLTDGIMDNQWTTDQRKPQIIVDFGGRVDLRAFSVTGANAQMQTLYYKLYISTDSQATWKEAGVDVVAQFTVVNADGNYYPDFIDPGFVEGNYIDDTKTTFCTLYGADKFIVQPVIFKDIQVGVTHVKIVPYGNSHSQYWPWNSISEINAFGTASLPTPTPDATQTPTPTSTASSTPTAIPTSTPAVTPPFSDLGNYAWAADYIISLHSQGVINGYADGTFKPGNNITRGEFAKMLAVAFNIYDPAAVSKFTDVPADKWYNSYVASLEKEGLAQGNGDGTFSPEAPITREAMFTFNARALAKFNGVTLLADDSTETASTLGNFVDGGDVSSWAKGYVATNIKLQIVQGSNVDGGKALYPKNPITRAEVAVVLDKTMSK